MLIVLPSLPQLIAYVADGSSLGKLTGQLSEHAIGWLKRALANTSNASVEYLVNIFKKFDYACIGMMGYDLVDPANIPDTNEKLNKKLWLAETSVHEYNLYKNMLPIRCKYWVEQVETIVECGDSIPQELTHACNTAVLGNNTYKQLLKEFHKRNVDLVGNNINDDLIPEPLDSDEEEEREQERTNWRAKKVWKETFENATSIVQVSQVLGNASYIREDDPQNEFNLNAVDNNVNINNIDILSMNNLNDNNNNYNNTETDTDDVSEINFQTSINDATVAHSQRQNNSNNVNIFMNNNINNYNGNNEYTYSELDHNISNNNNNNNHNMNTDIDITIVTHNHNRNHNNSMSDTSSNRKYSDNSEEDQKADLLPDEELF